MSDEQVHGELLTPPLSEEAAHWVARVEEIAPVLREHRERTERDRVSPQPVFDALRDAGLHRMWVSEEFGGSRVALRTGSAVIQALARIDASVAWQVGVQGAIGRLSDYLPEPTARKLFKDHTGLIVGGVNPSGRAERVDGGYRLTGQWGFASGSAFADWLVCASLVTENGQVRKVDQGPEIRMLFVPRSDAVIQDTWHTLGLRGTGSNHYTVTDVFVPDEYTAGGLEITRPPQQRPSRAYAVGYYDFGPFTSASTVLGVAQDALDAFKELAAKKTPQGASSPLAVRHTVQEKLARAEMQLHTAKLLLADAADQVNTYGASGGDRLTALVRLTAATVAENTVAAVDSLYSLAGSTSVYASSRLERCFRDIHSAVKHITLSSTHFEMAGQYLLGGALQMRR